MAESTVSVSIPLSSKNYHLNSRFHPYIKDFAESTRGHILDIGCGTKPHRQWFSGVKSYTGIDINDAGNADVRGTATDLPFQDNSFNSIISTQVLEHVSDPFAFFEEINRVLKAGGDALISTNQMYPLHEIPHDYYRFTRYGLEYLAEEVDLIVDRVIEVGTLPMRVCCELNYYSQKLPTQAHNLFCKINNSIFSPIVDRNNREDYIVTAIVVSQEQPH